MPLTILGNPKIDLRTQTPVVYAQMAVNEYLSLVGTDFDKFSIQRRREKHPAYSRMKEDIKREALLPTITLSVLPTAASALKQLCAEGNLTALAARLGITGEVNILDGLQRTYILHDLACEGHQFIPNQSVHLEIRIEERARSKIKCNTPRGGCRKTNPQNGNPAARFAPVRG